MPTCEKLQVTMASLIRRRLDLSGCQRTEDGLRHLDIRPSVRKCALLHCNNAQCTCPYRQAQTFYLAFFTPKLSLLPFSSISLALSDADLSASKRAEEVLGILSTTPRLFWCVRILPPSSYSWHEFRIKVALAPEKKSLAKEKEISHCMNVTPK